VTIIRPVVVYVLQTLKFSIWEIKNLFVIERQILRKTFGPIQSKEGLIIRNNNELQELIKGEDIVEYGTTQRIKWWEHLNRMKGVKLTDWNAIGGRTKGRPKNR
jgi:hypothetical protein